MDYDDFSDTPRTIGEIRSEKNWSAEDWTPRDALISTLRDIDEGKINPDTLIIFMCTHEEGKAVKTNWRMSGDDLTRIIGSIEMVKHRLLSACNPDEN